MELSSDDLQAGVGGGVTSRPVTFPGLPPGLVPTSATTSVRLKITKVK